ncbi:MAG TPA: exodeoxyribonuclease V subunit gamma, partial [Xanthomonadaceae bacterium]|nr:exodeoxyribonuclease V subunit gamma [Xanthomonadaceae bacterium]
LLDSNPPASALAPQVVIAAHPGMRQWLLGALARKRGVGGIVANLDVVLPGTWLDRQAERILGEGCIATLDYRREVLRWRIHAALGGLHDARIDAYLRGHDVARRRFQLADRLARIYTQYLVYRPDWLQAWAGGRDPVGDSGFHLPLWRELRASIGAPHRGERLARLTAAFVDAAIAHDDEPLHVFGLSHMAPSELAVLRAVARHRLVVLYVPDPCREFWGGLRGERSRLRELVARDADGLENEAVFREHGHPLLASWGRLGQHFLLALDDSEAAIDERHYLDKPEAAIEPANRLQRVQESIRRAEPALIASREDAAVQRVDRSLRIHACHTRLRELEVLRDALLRELDERADLKPSDILVMAPNIGAYAPLLPAVFGEAGAATGPLPYHLADVAIANTHPLFGAFARLLDLPRSRMTAPEVVDLLGVPQIADRFSLSSGDVETIAGWLANGRIHWSLDAAFRERFDVPPIAEHSFAWGMDRMLAGYAMGAIDDGDVVHLADGTAIAPLAGIAGPQAEALGALDAALVEFARWCELGARPLRAGAWAGLLEKRFDAVFRVDPQDAAAREAGVQLRRAIRGVADEPGQCGLDPELEFAVVREVLRERMAATPERQAFLAGGATFCGMVPQRAIPFRVIAVLGLDDGVFPRTDGDGGLDLIGRHHRMGDRDVRSDDRYLFLQTLMSARDALHLSWIGQDVHDGQPRNPAAPLAELLATLDAAAGLAPDTADIDDASGGMHRRPWLVRHPLQPYDARYFDGSDPALFSYRIDFAQMDPVAQAAKAGAADAGIAAFMATRAAAPVADGDSVSLADVLAYFRDPAKQFLTRRMNVRLDALADDRLDDSESLEAKVDAIENLARRLFLDAAARGEHALSDTPPEWLRSCGLLPPGRLGDDAWAKEAEKVDALLENIEAYPAFASGLPRRAAQPSARRIGDWRIEGELPRACETRDARWIIDAFPGKREDQLDFRQRIGLFIEWGLLRLDDPCGEREVRLCLPCAGTKHGWQDAINAWDVRFVAAARERDQAALAAMAVDLRSRLLELFDHWRAAQSDPRWYFPKTSWAAASGPEDMTIAWQGSGGSYGSVGERDYAPGYAKLLAGMAGLDATWLQDEALSDSANRLRALIELRAPGTSA